ncbi:MAG TPA: hypothetical protein DGT23_24615 [Micromonosporaceae bacterium]|nr:hypothetical protein [Micromonosporaceae bacterium]
MRTADPNRHLDDFVQQAQDGLSRLTELEAALKQATSTASLRKAIVEDAAFRLGALWEVFQGRWHVCAISRDPEVFVAETRKLLEKQIKDDVRATVIALHPQALTVPPHPTLSQIEAVLDLSGFNITFKDAQAWMASSGVQRGSFAVARKGTPAERIAEKVTKG